MFLDPSRVTVILIGTGIFPRHSLPRVLEVYTNVVRLKQALMRPDVLGVPLENIHLLIDRTRAQALRELRHACQAQCDQLVVYYCGHGKIPDDSAGLLLTFTDTTEYLEDQTALRFDDFRSVVAANATATKRILILDCCFAGQALPFVLADEDSVLASAIGAVDRGTAAIAAAGDYETAKRGLNMTPFTEALVNTLEGGVSTGGVELTIDVLFDAIRKKLPHHPRPRLSKAADDSEIVFARNATRSGPPPACAPSSIAAYARSLQSMLFVAAIDKQMSYTRLYDDMIKAMERGRFDDLRHHYLGERGAKLWVELATHPDYAHSAKASLRLLLQPLKEHLDTKPDLLEPSRIAVIGLGSGDGEADRMLLQQICDSRSDTEIAYFPVDISMALLQTAAREVADYAALKRVAVLPVLTELQNISNVLRMWRNSVSTEIYTMLGCTLGNFRDEKRVLQPVADAMQVEHALLLDARCYGGRISDVYLKSLVSQFNHKRNKNFALGPLSQLGHRGEPKISVSIRDALKRNPFSEIHGTRTIVTTLTLDDQWRELLGCSPELNAFDLSWSNIYDDSTFVSWLTETMDLAVVARSPASVAPGQVATVAFLLTKKVAGAAIANEPESVGVEVVEDLEPLKTKVHDIDAEKASEGAEERTVKLPAID